MAFPWSERSVDHSRLLSNAESFERFYERVHRNVFRYIMALSSGDEALAEDITAEAFLRAWRSRNSFSGDEDDALGWLITIARRLLVDQRRYAAIHTTEEFPTNDLPEDGAPDAEQIWLTQEQEAQLVDYLQRLPDIQRDMLVQRYLLGWRVNQIAAHLGMPQNTVSATIRRALLRLRGWLAANGEGALDG